jgi:hypothetical protein
VTDPIVCNPVDLPYAYSYQQVQGHPSMVWREGADPSLIRYRDRYYLFVSMSGGFWHSDDLASWQFVPTPDLPILDYAPDVREIDGALVFSASKYDQPCSFWRTTDPLSAVFEELPGTFPFWDPNLFQDDDGRVYLYWGCSNEAPIHGVELDRTTFRPIGETVDLIHGDHVRHGWEWKGPGDGVVAPEAVTTESGKDPRPFVEGAWMTKFEGIYYLQYAAPGTELNTYGDGYYTSSSPLGPFTYSPDNPFSSVPGGFAPGAGHGSTVQDRFGNWWHVATIRISVGHVFERRIGIYPAGFDADGVLFSNQEFADHPSVVAQRRVDPWAEVSTGWRLLSYQRPVVATSWLDGSSVEAVVDEDIRSVWVAASAGPGEGVTVDIGDGCTVRAVQVNLADSDVTSLAPPPGELTPDEFARRNLSTIDHAVPYVVEVSGDGVVWDRVGDEGGADAPHRLVVLAAGTAARYVRVTGGPGAWGSAFALRGVRVFGERAGSPPVAPAVDAVRLDDRTARVEWTAAIDADGVNVRYGRSPDKLYHSWLVYGRDDLLISTLSAGVDYWVAVDAFNGSGLTAGVAVPMSTRGAAATRSEGSGRTGRPA